MNTSRLPLTHLIIFGLTLSLLTACSSTQSVSDDAENTPTYTESKDGYRTLVGHGKIQLNSSDTRGLALQENNAHIDIDIHDQTEISVDSTLESHTLTPLSNGWLRMGGHLNISLYSNDYARYHSFELVVYLDHDGLAGDIDNSYIIPVALSGQGGSFQLSSANTVVFSHGERHTLDTHLLYYVDLLISDMPAQNYSGNLYYELIGISDTNPSTLTYDFTYINRFGTAIGVKNFTETPLFETQAKEIQELGEHTYLSISNHSVFIHENDTITELTGPDFSGINTVAHNPNAHTAYIATQGGEGFLYQFDTQSREFTSQKSLNNKDYTAMAYNTENDTLFALLYNNRSLYILDAQGFITNVYTIQNHEAFHDDSYGDYKQLFILNSNKLLVVSTTAHHRQETSQYFNILTLSDGQVHASEAYDTLPNPDELPSVEASPYASTIERTYTFVDSDTPHTFTYYDGVTHLHMQNFTIDTTKHLDGVTSIHSSNSQNYAFLGNTETEAILFIASKENPAIQSEYTFLALTDDPGIVPLLQASAYNYDEQTALFFSFDTLFQFDLETGTVTQSQLQLEETNIIYDAVYYEDLIYTLETNVTASQHTGLTHIYIYRLTGEKVTTITLKESIDLPLHHPLELKRVQLDVMRDEIFTIQVKEDSGHSRYLVSIYGDVLEL